MERINKPERCRLSKQRRQLLETSALLVEQAFGKKVWGVNVIPDNQREGQLHGIKFVFDMNQ